MQKKQVAVIDVGSSAITVLIGERGVNKTFLIKARKDYAYDGFAEGEFFDAAGVKKILFSAAAFIADAAKKGEVRVFIGVPGEFTQVTVKNSQISFSGKKRITESDVDTLFDSAFVPASAKYSLINRSAIVYELDDYRRVANPIGVSSEILKGKLSFIVCSNYFIETVKNTVKASGFSDVECVSTALAEVMYLLEPETRDRIAMFLDIGYISATFSLVQGDGILYQRSFSYGGGFITAALTQKFGMDFDVAEELKRKVNLSAINGDSYNVISCSDGKYYNTEEARKTVKESLDGLCEEIENCREGSGYNIPEYVPLLITGGGISWLRGAKEHVANRIGATVEIVAPKVPLMDKPTESSALSLLDLTFAEE
ncbi:MAG: pilus assembly protein PilM [Clostridia bacterium]|nr:pilus assembly protein PilM [Clostridia bacterium]